jgi:hypothetical protein
MQQNYNPSNSPWFFSCVLLMMLYSWESAHFYLGQFQDECFKALSHADQISRFVAVLFVWGVLG